MTSQKTPTGDRARQQDATATPATAEPPLEQAVFDRWVDRRLKSMHDAVLHEAIPDDLLRILADAPASPDRSTSERGTSDEPHGRQTEPDRRRG
ncbi:MAG: NepR family anti-sigma factor [Alphaproteobacteria bacterium]